MNGSVTMEVLNLGVEADSFKEAVEKIKALPNFVGARIYREDNSVFKYEIKTLLTVDSKMVNQPLSIIK